eukprot:scaffold1534_cov158-Ochromonas_danica.AAC.8
MGWDGMGWGSSDNGMLTDQYLFLTFYRAKVFESIRDIDNRKVNLLNAKESLTQYLEICQAYRILHPSDVKKWEKAPMTAEDRRMAKIEKFKREKAMKQRIAELERLLILNESGDSIDYEEEQREVYLLMMKSYAGESLDNLEMLEEEIKMLEIREEQLKLEESRTGKQKQDGTKKEDEGWRSTQYPTLDPNRPGISVTKTVKVGDQILMSRETVKVFGTHIAPPTMSVEEFGDLQVQELQERAQREAEAPKGPRRYKQLLEEGEEDDADLVDKATEEDRRWDDWKDNNPRGWGNKMGKRF